MKALALMVWDKKIFKVFLSVAMETRVFHESASPMDHLCEVSLKPVGRFQRRRFFKLKFTD